MNDSRETGDPDDSGICSSEIGKGQRRHNTSSPGKEDIFRDPLRPRLTRVPSGREPVPNVVRLFLAKLTASEARERKRRGKFKQTGSLPTPEDAKPGVS